MTCVGMYVCMYIPTQVMKESHSINKSTKTSTAHKQITYLKQTANRRHQKLSSKLFLPYLVVFGLRYIKCVLVSKIIRIFFNCNNILNKFRAELVYNFEGLQTNMALYHFN